MPTYTATNINIQGQEAFSVGTDSQQIVVFSNTYDFVTFVQAQRSENIVLTNALIRTNNIEQLSKPIIFKKLDVNGDLKGNPHTPFIDSYAFQSQVVLKGDDKMIFNGLNTIEYEINPTTEVTITFQIETKNGYTNMLLNSIENDFMSLAALLDKENDLREAQEKI
jgi:hypothetical protein